MASTGVTFFLALLSVVYHHGTAYPSGAPGSTCISMYPHHKNTDTQVETGIYEITTAPRANYNPGSIVTVTIRAPAGRTIRGVEIGAHRTSVNVEELIGTFSDPEPSDKLQFMNCQGGSNNVVTHANGEPVSEVKVKWTANNQNVGPIVFWITVVESFFVFYHGLRSNEMSPGFGSGQVIQPSLIASLVNHTKPEIDWDGCGDSKGCLLYPRYCTGDDCKVAVSFMVNKDEDTVTFEVMGETDGYVSLGFSDDRNMGNDQTITCATVYDRVSIQNGYNAPGKWNVKELGFSLTQMEASSSMDGKVYCRFTRPMSMVLNILGKPTTFDLKNDHHLFVAWGGTYLKSDNIQFHTEMPVVSDTKIDFNDYSTYRGSVMKTLIRAHSSLMAIAWLGFAGLAIILARYYKDGFNGKEICGIKIWFHIHRGSAILTFLLTAAGLTCVLVELDGEIVEDDDAFEHMCLGFTVTALVCAQVLAGLVRPSPNNKIRPLFNFFHRLFGTAALVIAAAAIVYAYKMEEFSYTMQQFGERTVAIWAAIFVFLEILMAGYQFFATKCCNAGNRSDDYDLDKTDDEIPVEKQAPPSHFLLAIFLLFTACSIAAALCMTVFF